LGFFLLIHCNQQQSLAFVGPSELITVDKWFEWLSEPRRAKSGLPVTEQQFFTGSPQPFVSFGYYGWLSEPVRPKKGLGAHEQSASVEPPEFPNLFSTIPWFEPLNDPVRFRRPIQLQIDWAPFAPAPVVSTVVVTTTLSSPVLFKSRFIYQGQTNTPFVAERVTLDKWWEPLAEPVWPKKGLKAWLQQFLSPSPAPVRPVDVRVTLFATETNADSALFAVVTYGRATRANVSIEEIGYDDSANVSLEEEGRGQANTSIEET